MTKHRNCGSRIETILSLCDKASVIADIGCDHGYITRELIERNIAETVLACDISEKSLQKAKSLFINLKANQTVEFVVGDGLCVLNNTYADAVIIAGMGAFEIMRILNLNSDTVKHVEYFVFCAHKNTGELRKFLSNKGFEILTEILAFDNGRFYECIKAKWDGRLRFISELDCELSQKLIEQRDPLLRTYLSYRINRIDNIFKDISDYKKRSDLQIKIDLKHKMEELLKCL